MRRPVRFVDDKTGEQFIRAGETIAFVRYVAGERGLHQSTLRARLSEIGVQAVRFEHHYSPHPKAVLYQLPEDLVEYVEAASPSPAPTRKQQSLIDNERASRWPA